MKFGLQNRRNVFFVSLLLFVLVVWTFFPSVHCDFLFYDEHFYVQANPHVNSGLSWSNVLWAFSSLEYSNWHPLTWISHMLDVQIYGLDPWGHHLTNILFHALNTVLIFLVFRKITGAGWQSLVVAVLFAFHPLRVQSVTSISERKDVLSTMFWLLTMWAYARYARSKVESRESRAGTGRMAFDLRLSTFDYFLALFFFACGLMSKTMLVTLPFVLLLLDFWPLQRWEWKRKWNLILEKVPFLALTVVVSITAYIAQARGGMTEEIVGLSFSDRLGNALISYVRYPGKFFWPENLCVLYPHPGHWPLFYVLLAGLFVVGVSVMAWLKRRQKPYLFVGWFWYLGTLVPVIGLVQLSAQSMADRYTYIPFIGIYLILVWGLHEITERWRYREVILSTVVVSAFFACVAMTRYEIHFWKDNMTVLRRVIEVTKDNYVAHNNLGVLLLSQQPDAAFAEFKEAVRINPNYANAQRHLGDEFYVRGFFDDAIAHYEKSLELDPSSASAGIAEFALGFAHYKKGQLDEALNHFQKSVDIDPDNTDRRNNFGAALLTKGRVDEAISQFQKALQLAPGSAVAHSNLNLAVEIKRQAMTKTNNSLQ